MDREYQQLRFDISEKVRLHPQQPGIKRLVELDLYPDVEIEDQETHLRIHGYLRLAGKYIGDEEDEISKREEADEGDEAVSQEWQEGESMDEIAFVIPVEITLPSDRVDIDQLATEVESFDYQVLSPFELQVEAVLTIDGLLADPKKEERDDSDSVVSFAGSSALSEKEGNPHETEEESPDEVHLIHVEDGGEPAREKDEPDMHESEEIQVLSQESSKAPHEDEGWTEERPEEDEADHLAVESSAAGESPAEEWFPDSPSTTNLAWEGEAGTAPKAGGEEAPAKEREEPETNSQTNFVRFGSQSSDDDLEEKFHLARQLLRKPSPDEFGPERADGDSLVEDETWDEDAGASAGESADSAEADPVDDEKGEQKVDQGEGLHWARRFLGEKEDTFVKMRMVIVQKNESLDSLADRYDVSPSQILRLNNLDSGNLEEGQIIYIPGEERKTAP